MKIVIDSRDLGYTIDTYNMFENNADEPALEYLQEEYPGITWDDIDWEFNHPEYVKGIAADSINILHNEFVTHGDGTIRSIDLVNTGSPKFHNYTTDYYTATWDIDESKLKTWIDKHNKQFIAYQRESSWGAQDPDTENYFVCALDLYTQATLEPEIYEDQMFEAINETGSNVLEYEISADYLEKNATVK